MVVFESPKHLSPCFPAEVWLHGQTAPMAVTSKFEEASRGCHSCGESAPVPFLDHQIQSLMHTFSQGLDSWLIASNVPWKKKKHLSKREAKFLAEMENDGKAITKWIWINTYINTIFRGMNIYLPAILM